MATVNLSTKYAKQVEQRFTAGSLLQGRLINKFDFVGARSVKVYTINPVTVNNYDRNATANGYGTPELVSDSLQELVMAQDKSFSGIIDKGDGLDQSINKAGRFVKVQMDEAIIPMKDKYGFAVLANKGGMIVGSGTAISAANVIARLSAGRKYLIDHRVPVKGRTLFVSTDMFNALVETDHFKNLDKLGGKAVANGQIGEIFGSPVVEVPSDLMPAGVNFIWVHKNSGTSPSKIAETKMHTDPPGLSGNLVEGRFYWDTFVFGAKADGVYVDVTTGGGVSVLAAPAVNAATGAITGVTAGATAYYTLDGTDPRYSDSRLQGTATGAVEGQTVRAYQENAGNASVYPSPVATMAVTGG